MTERLSIHAYHIVSGPALPPCDLILTRLHPGALSPHKVTSPGARIWILGYLLGETI